ncbi:type I polyketide synthase [Nannocystis bainbridge]|uniref:Type I polyketide synthase n=1 Tax=Nannocystis bainbridge TaxID=2995303 RepID=A0ABT5E765_9BACT|nr:type I polyketide synthase [Nannocystis bainbridge]MDC0721164.1 type I polyketide synthase [Nannocystis bainbridge]
MSDPNIPEHAIAIVGMAGRFPGAPDLDTFWANLRGGVESIARLGDDDLRAAGVDPALAARPEYVRARPVLGDIESFDAGFFGISAREAELMDPQQRLFLECAWEALEDAGLDPAAFPGAVGVYAGSTMSTYYAEHLRGAPAAQGWPGWFQAFMGNDKDYLATRLAYLLDLRGPCVAVQTACSTSLVAVHLASTALLDRECDLALAGGVTIRLPHRAGYLYEPGALFAPDGRCRAFDADARGTIFGNGAGVVVLRRLEDALAAGDAIHAVVRGSAVGNDGAHKVGFTAPSQAGQARVIGEALGVAGVDPASIQYIEAHGTGTPLGDPIEFAALSAVFRDVRPPRRIAVGSIKPNIGHLESAAGVASLIKTVLALRHRQLPPSLFFTRLNPEIDLTGSALHVNAALTPWPEGQEPRRAGVSSFGIGGTNAHVIVEEAPASARVPAPREAARPEASPPESSHRVASHHDSSHREAARPGASHPESSHLDSSRREAARSGASHSESSYTESSHFDSLHPDSSRHDSSPPDSSSPNSSPPDSSPPDAVLLPLSARDPQALRALVGAWRARLAEPGADLDLLDLAHGAGARRAHHPWRLAVVGRDCAELDAELARLEAAPDTGTRRDPGARPRIVFVFPGQGSQWAGMSRTLFAREPAFRAALQAVDPVVQRHAGFSPIAALHSDEAAWLARIDHLQPVLFAVQVALAAQWRAWGVEPDAVVGHSMGEIAAAHVAGVLTLDDAARIVSVRSRLMRPLAGRGAMAVVELSQAAARERLRGREDRVSLAVSNSPRSTVLSGDPEVLDDLLAELAADQIFARKVKVDVASHSPQVEPLRAPLLAALRGLAPGPARVPMTSTVDLRDIAGRELGPEYWVRNLREPVQFAAAVERLLVGGEAVFIEVAPHPVLLPFVESMIQGRDRSDLAVVSGRRDQDERAVLLAALGALYTRGFPVAWPRLSARPARPLPLPRYPWQRTRHWIAPTRAAAVGRVQGAHPLLGGALRSSLDRTWFWERSLDLAAAPYLADHRLGGLVVVPGAEFIAMALAAAEVVGAGSHALVDLAVPSPAIVPDGASLQLQTVVRADPDGFTVQIASPAGDDAWQVHVTATLRPADPQSRLPSQSLSATQSLPATFAAQSLPATQPLPTTQPLPASPSLPASLASQSLPTSLATSSPEFLAAIQAPLARPIAGPEYYDALAAVGLAYGPAFQAVRHVWSAPGEALGELHLPDGVTGDLDPHPVLLDAAFQVLLAARGEIDPAAGPRVLAGIDRLVRHAPAGRAAYSHVHVRRADADGFVADVDLHDLHGGLLLTAVGLQLRRIDLAAALARHAPRPVVPYMAPEWHAAPPPAGPARPGRWLLIAEPGPFADAVVTGLHARDQACERLPLGSAASAESLVQALEQRREGPPWRGVIHLGALDESASIASSQAAPAQDSHPVQSSHQGRASAPPSHHSHESSPIESSPIESPLPDESYDLDAARLDAAQTVGYGVGLHLVQALARLAWRDPPRLWFVTRDLAALPDAGPLDITHAPLWGLGRTVPFEHPELRCKRVDVDRDLATASALVDELWADDLEEEVALRGPTRHLARVVPLELPPAEPPAIHGDATYLITGGLGGLGLLAAGWLVDRGARHLALLGRGPATADQTAALAELERRGARLEHLRCDVADLEALATALHRLDATMPPLRGVLHTAGVLDDGLIAGQTVDRLRTVLAPKLRGACNLHRLTRARPLDLFVLYSSVSAVLGAPGLANYVAANAALDALAHHRRRLGLPATSIDWGLFSGVGMGRLAGASLSARGVGDIRPDDGAAILLDAVASGRPQLGVALLDAQQWLEFYPQRAASTLLAPLLGRGSRTRPAAPAAQALRAALRDGDPAGRRLALDRFITAQVAEIVRIEPTRIDRDLPFRQLGFDSLLGLELRNRLEAGLGLTLSATLIWTWPTVNELARHLGERLGWDAPPPAPAPAPVDLDDLDDLELLELGERLLG